MSDIATIEPSATPSTPKKSSPKASCSSTPSNSSKPNGEAINVSTPNSALHLSNQYGFPLNYNGQIQLIFGNMFAGKTSELLRRLRRYQYAQKETVLVKYINDDRYSKENVSTHDLVQQKAIPTDRLEKIASQLLGYHVIGIDEGQFFPDLVEFCEAAANGGKIVIVSALDGTFQRKQFGNVLSLVPMAESVVKLKAVCMVCGKDAAFSKRITDEQQTEVIGGSDKYIATCRKCYMTRNTPYSKKSKSVFQDSMLEEHEECSDYSEHCEIFSPQKH
ncbi:thymidine kinase [Naegleria gruberi]|uniref:Thymidine kinase n=1 Tax=Naegleria gruberi TaxID=5762 RepID=D2W1T6_NAEGR|nr:thymidine kinase [Naegleria gruberi]EFC36973.1 thymidine kinase [Naegleria gruberi]|eukprot:XP_002669717.1 thymidine kinase [Naegleria gruberi strain NEG-M]